jgi:hypothetical protein
MTQNEKDLLLKDLCSRLDTNLVCSIYRTDDEGVGYRDEILHGYCKGDIWYEFYFREDCSIGIDNVSKIKPYLFPFSSMTEEQKWELDNLVEESVFQILHSEDGNPQPQIPMDWYNKNHFDYRGLIPMGLAIDATGLNIY